MFLYILESIVSFSAYEELVTSWWLHSFCLLTYHTQDLCTRKVPSSSPSHLAVARFQKFLPQRKDIIKLQIQSLPTVQHFSGGSSGECWTGFRSRECLFPIYFGGYKRKLHSLHSCEFMKGVASTRILLFRWFGRSIGNMTTVSCPGSISLHIWKHSLFYVEIPPWIAGVDILRTFFPRFLLGPKNCLKGW